MTLTQHLRHKYCWYLSIHHGYKCLPLAVRILGLGFFAPPQFVDLSEPVARFGQVEASGLVIFSKRNLMQSNTLFHFYLFSSILSRCQHRSAARSAHSDETKLWQQETNASASLLRQKGPFPRRDSCKTETGL